MPQADLPERVDYGEWVANELTASPHAGLESSDVDEEALTRRAEVRARLGGVGFARVLLVEDLPVGWTD